MPDETKALTQREAIQSGRLGGFNAALLKAAESGNVYDLADAYAKADQYIQALLEWVFPDAAKVLRIVHNDWPNRQQWVLALSNQFPRLLDLDGPARFEQGGGVEAETTKGDAQDPNSRPDVVIPMTADFADWMLGLTGGGPVPKREDEPTLAEKKLAANWVPLTGCCQCCGKMLTEHHPIGGYVACRECCVLDDEQVGHGYQPGHGLSQCLTARPIEEATHAQRAMELQGHGWKVDWLGAQPVRWHKPGCETFENLASWETCTAAALLYDRRERGVYR